MEPDVLALIDYLIIETKDNQDLLIQRIKQILFLIPDESVISLLEMFKQKKILELEQKKESLSNELLQIKEWLKKLNES